MILSHLTEIATFMLDSLINIWPYLLISIPLAVAVQMSGASNYISTAFDAKPMTAIVLATAVGAFSPFCGCTVIPIVASLLIAGVPLAPVMAFWVASPSMGPEIFFLSVPLLGWELAVGRLVATFLLSLGAGFITHAAMQRGWLGEEILRQKDGKNSVPTLRDMVVGGWRRLKGMMQPSPVFGFSGTAVSQSVAVEAASDCCGSNEIALVKETSAVEAGCGCGSEIDAASSGSSCAVEPPMTFWHRLGKESWGATALVIKFMALAFLIEALIIFYVPEAWVAGLVGHQNPSAIITAALIGVPTYTTELTALPMVGGLLQQGMDPGAALAFLIAGPTTTLPAMAAVWYLASRRVFALYVSFALFGAIVMGYAFNIVLMLI